MKILTKEETEIKETLEQGLADLSYGLSINAPIGNLRSLQEFLLTICPAKDLKSFKELASYDRRLGNIK